MKISYWSKKRSIANSPICHFKSQPTTLYFRLYMFLRTFFLHVFPSTLDTLIHDFAWFDLISAEQWPLGRIERFESWTCSIVKSGCLKCLLKAHDTCKCHELPPNLSGPFHVDWIKNEQRYVHFLLCYFCFNLKSTSFQYFDYF